jgi:hypothetical protein
MFGAVPGLLTGAGLTLTFVAILVALKSVSYNEGHANEPISGIANLINGLSGKFLSSIVRPAAIGERECAFGRAWQYLYGVVGAVAVGAELHL